jgi:hypothetical protein
VQQRDAALRQRRRQLGGERNRGQSGWEYKVDDVSGSTGAADPSGARGDGRRLRAGDRVVWFWCQSSRGGCERTLEVGVSSLTPARGDPLRVTVTGNDNEGRGAPIAGALVRVGSATGVTGTGGGVTVRAPASHGRYEVLASRGGLVPAFPGMVAVR